MKDVIQKYKQLAQWQQVAIVAGVFILGLFLLPNTIVYAVAAFVSYKLIDKKSWKYTAVSVLSVITFFSGILWIAGDTPQPATDNNEVEIATPQENETVPTATTTEEVPVNQDIQADVDTSELVTESNTENTDDTPAVTSAPAESSSTYSEPTASSGNDKWYTSSHYSAKYYYHESCDGWQGLSSTHLNTYNSEAALLADHPAHTLHPECSPN